MTGDLTLPVPGGHLSDEGVAQWTEPIRTYTVQDWVSDRVLDDGPLLVETLDRLKDRLHRDLEARHMVQYGVLEHDQRYDAMRNVTWLRLRVRCHKHPAWLMEILADVRAAVLEDQQWLDNHGG